MSLTTSLNIARSALAVSGGLSSVISRNIAGANDPTYARRTANLVSLAGGGASISSVERTTNKVLVDLSRDALSQNTMQQSLTASLDRLEQTVNDPDLETSPAALIQKFSNALQLYATTPQDNATGAAAVASARDLVQGLNGATTTVQDVREQADANMASSVGKINALLGQLQEVNGTIALQGTSGDVNDALDQRDSILSQLSQEIGIKTLTRGNNDIVVYTDSGVTLFDKTARDVSFAPTLTYGATTAGNSVYVDGVPVAGDAANMSIHSGRIAGLAQMRDSTAPQLQGQLDEVARGLINAFAEKDQSASPTLPDVPGLFSWSGAPAMPGNAMVAGLAGSISVNANADPSAGGNAALLRDGSIADPGNVAYTYNTSGGAGFSGRLQDLMDKLSTPQSFDAAAGLATTTGVGDFATASVGWLEASRQSASNDADYSATLLDRANESLSNASGVNLDEEMTSMLEIERSYQASAKLISAIDSLFNSFLQTI